MNEVKAHLKHVRISARKMRLVVDAVRGKTVPEALDQLQLIRKRGAAIVTKTLRSAMANADHNLNLDPQKMYISKIIVNEGLDLKRFRPAAHGSAHGYKKHASHLEITLAPQKGIDASLKAKPSKKKATDETKEVKTDVKEEPAAKATAAPKAKKISKPKEKKQS